MAMVMAVGRSERSVQPRPALARAARELADGAATTVVVIGSGYGGGVAASRLARAGQDVIVLERGKEWRAGEFPTGKLEAAAQLQVHGPAGDLGQRTGLYDLHSSRNVDVMVGCGLGGTSLINAGVSLEPDPGVFEHRQWPQAIRDDRTTQLADGFRRARAMLAPQAYPRTVPKLAALRRSADALHRDFALPPLNIAFRDGINAADVMQYKCNDCGNCVTGCNNSSKSTVDMTFLADAKAHGAALYTEVTVRWIERRDGALHVVWRCTDDDDDDGALRTVRAEIVVLAAGVLGSTEILLRSRDRGLAVSPMVGQRLSANGDYVSFGYNNNARVHAVGDASGDPGDPVGPTITGMIRAPAAQALTEQYIVEDGAFPSVFADALPLAFAAATVGLGTNTATTIAARVAQAARALESLAPGGAYTGAIDHTQMYLSIGHDNAGGALSLDRDRLRIAWDDAGAQPIYRAMQQTTIDATAATGGIAVREPVWTQLFDNSLVTVHPLGGCPMGEDATCGAVNDRGQVFSGGTGTDVHAGLYVADGSIVPTSLGVNPLLTISALAERAMTLLIQDRGWTEV